MLDMSGGVLSFLQLIIDAGLQNDWSGILGNPTKLGLSNISIFFDVIFLLQHYWWYRGAREDNESRRVGNESGDEGHRPLLGDGDEGRV